MNSIRDFVDEVRKQRSELAENFDFVLEQFECLGAENEETIGHDQLPAMKNANKYLVFECIRFGRKYFKETVDEVYVITEDENFVGVYGQEQNAKAAVQGSLREYHVEKVNWNRKQVSEFLDDAPPSGDAQDLYKAFEVWRELHGDDFDHEEFVKASPLSEAASVYAIESILFGMILERFNPTLYGVFDQDENLQAVVSMESQAVIPEDGFVQKILFADIPS